MPPFVEYINAGLSCIPIRADGSKAPELSWREFTERRPTEDEAGQWEKRYRGVALVGGAVSGNLEVLDIDEPTLVRPFLEALKATDPALMPKLCIVRTPRRNVSGQAGAHLIYRCEIPGGGNLKLAMTEPEPEVDAAGNPVLNPATGEHNYKPRTLIETRGDGGYAITIGSDGACHPSGRQYEHAYGVSLTALSVLTAAERATLHAISRTFDRSISEIHQEPQIRGYERSGDSPGDEFNRRATWPEILQPFGWQLVGEFGGVKRWRRPGKAVGISATTGLLSKAGNELLVVFSTNAHPFEGVGQNGRSGVSYSKFAAYALLNHSGNYEAAAKALVQLGYGTPARKTEQKTRVLKTTVADAERRYFEMLSQGETELITTGVPALDKALGGGVDRGEMIVIGGLPSHGKTVCGLQALRAMIEARQHAVLVSHEMGGLSIAKRMIQSRTKLEARDWFGNVDYLRRDSAEYWHSCGELFLLEQCRSIDTIEREIDQIAAEYKLAMIVIDHAQLTDGKGGSRYEILTNASARFKQLAVKHECVALVLSQLNREAAKGEQAAHHLKETGALEQDADVVVLVKWPWKANPDEADPRKYIFTVCKNRNRPIVHWQVEARFNPAQQRIEADEPQAKPAERYTEFDSFGE